MLLNKKFFERSAVLVARDLIGCCLIKKWKNGKKEKFIIVETEAYEGPEDQASHAYRGQTLRNAVMFGDPGVWYVYLTYGMHYMLNIVCGPQGHPAAVLIRGVESVIGPARLTKKLGIDKRFNGKPATKAAGLYIERSDLKPKILNLKSTPRIGVDYSGPIWSKKRYRFVLKGFETKKFKK